MGGCFIAFWVFLVVETTLLRHLRGRGWGVCLLGAFSFIASVWEYASTSVFIFCFSALQQLCVQSEQSGGVSFFIWSQHCDNEFIWKFTLRGCLYMCACVRACARGVLALVCLFTHLHTWTKFLHANVQFLCACFFFVGHLKMCAHEWDRVWICQVAAGDQLGGASVGRWAYTHLCVALLHQLITHLHSNTQTAPLRTLHKHTGTYRVLTIWNNDFTVSNCQA